MSEYETNQRELQDSTSDVHMLLDIDLDGGPAIHQRFVGLTILMKCDDAAKVEVIIWLPTQKVSVIEKWL